MFGVTSPPTGLRAYRAVLAVPWLRRLTAVALFVRIPATATAITLTLHVVLQLGLGYAAAGLVVAASTVGMGVGAPLMGRLVDRRDLRTMVGLTLVVAGVFWALAPGLAYPVLLGAAFVGGLLATPVHAVIRQSVGVLAPPELRHTAYAVDAIMVDLSYTWVRSASPRRCSAGRSAAPPRRPLRRPRPPPQRTLKPTAANSAAMNASPASLRESAPRNTVQRPSAAAR